MFSFDREKLKEDFRKVGISMFIAGIIAMLIPKHSGSAYFGALVFLLGICFWVFGLRNTDKTEDKKCDCCSFSCRNRNRYIRIRHKK